MGFGVWGLGFGVYIGFRFRVASASDKIDKAIGQVACRRGRPGTLTLGRASALGPSRLRACNCPLKSQNCPHKRHTNRLPQHLHGL